MKFYYKNIYWPNTSDVEIAYKFSIGYRFKIQAAGWGQVVKNQLSG